MFSTIVVGTDGSSDAERAIDAAADLAAGRAGVEVHVVSANRSLTPGELDSVARSLPDEYREVLHGRLEADSRLVAARRLLEKAGVTATYHDVDGDPTDALLDTVAATGADLLIVGSRGEGPAKRLLHGSVSTKVLHHAPCAVLVIRTDGSSG